MVILSKKTPYTSSCQLEGQGSFLVIRREPRWGSQRENSRDLPRRLGKNIQGLRKAAGWTQVELEQRSRVYDVGALERGEKNLTLMTLFKLAKTLGVSPSKLLETSTEVTSRDKIRLEILGLLDKQRPRQRTKALEMVRLLLSDE